MDAYDAGSFAYVFQATVPRSLKVVLWGPLHASELGFEHWTYQDGGETGFVYHSSSRPLRLGVATASLIVVRRTGRAHLSIHMGGYPTDAAPEQRRIDCQSIVNEAELFLSRLAKETIRFQRVQEHVLVSSNDAIATDETVARAHA